MNTHLPLPPPPPPIPTLPPTPPTHSSVFTPLPLPPVPPPSTHFRFPPPPPPSLLHPYLNKVNTSKNKTNGPKSCCFAVVTRFSNVSPLNPDSFSWKLNEKGSANN